MNLPELKKRFKNKYAIRIIAGVLVVTLLGTGVSASSVTAKNSTVKGTETVGETAETEETEEAEEKEAGKELADKLAKSVSVEEKKIGKEETVYVIADSTGKEKNIIVSDHLINAEEKDTLEDASTLKDIENVKGDETFTQKGNKVTWKADGNDIFYQGTSVEKAPVSQKITYFLDGKEITPEKLAGQSGEVTIRVEYTNHEKTEAAIDGEKTEIYVPFVAIGGMILDDSFTDIKVKNGKVISDGNNNLVVGYTLPGLKESLDVTEDDFDGDVNIPDYYEVTANVENFELGMTMTVVANATNFIAAQGENDLSDVDDLLDTLTEATGQLADGSSSLAEGTDTLKSSMGEFSDGVSALKKGISDYTEGASRLTEGISELADKTSTLSSGATTLNDSAATLASGVATLDKALNTEFTDKEKSNMQEQVTGTIEKQESSIKKSARKSVEAEAETIQAQAEAAVDSQAAAIQAQAEAAVEAQTDAIWAQAVQAVDAAFAGGQYAAIQAGAKEQITSALNGQVSGVEGSVKEALVASGIPDETAAAIANQIATGIASGMEAAADQLAAGVADTAMLSAESAAGTAAVSGAKAAAGTAAVSGAKAAAGTAAVTGAKSAAGTAAVSGAKAAAGTAAVSGAKAAAGTAAVSGATAAAETAAYEGAKSAAGTAAISAAEQTKKNIAGNIEQQTESGYSLVTGSKALAEGTQSLAASVPTLISGITQLNDGGKELASNNDKLNQGAVALKDGTDAIVDGVDQLKDGAHQLADGIVEFNEEGVEEIIDSYNGEIQPLLDRIQAVLDAGADYQSFTDIAEGVDGSVKFIIKTDAIKVED